MKDMTAKEIKSQIYTQVTFDGKLLPDMAESYKVKSLVDELIRRAEQLENTKVCQCGH